MASERWLCTSCGATSDPSPEPPPGCARCDAPLHVGKFGLLQELGKERSARVFRGRESSGRAEVTVRLFPENPQLDLAGIREAVKRAAQLSHPVIAAPIDAGTHRNQVFIVEAAVPGIPVTEADVTFREGVGLMRNVALALDYAHGRGVVHPDLRAENIRISRESGSSLGESGWRASVTCFGIAAGGSVRDNVGAFGSILYAAVTGQSPRGSGSAPASPSSINPLVDSELEAIILLAMDSNGSMQPPSMEEIASELTRWLDGGSHPQTAPKAAAAVPPEAEVRPSWQTRAILGASVVVVLMLIYLVIRKAPAPLEPVPVVRTPQTRSPEPTPPAPPAVAPEAPPLAVEEKPPIKPEPPPPPKVEAPAEAAKPSPPPLDPPKPPPPIKPPEEKPPIKPEPPPPPKVEPPAEAAKPGPPPPEPPKPPPPIKPPEEKPAPRPLPVKPAEEKPAPPPPPPAKTPEEKPPAPKPPEEKPPVPTPPPPKPPAEKPVPPPESPPGVSVGELFGSHPDYGKFVKLNGKDSPAVGDELVALRKGKVVATLSVVRLTAPQPRRYPQGCAVCKLLGGEAEDGDDVRRIAK